MYNADPNLLEKFNSPLQTKANNNDPRPLVYITRNKTAITSQRYWEKTLITGIVGTRSSIAVRRPEGSLLADMIFVAQVEFGDAVIRYAEPKAKLTDTEWTTLTTIPNVSELSIMFDGYMTKHEDIVEAYTVGELPYVFYVDASNSLKYINLDDESISGTISDNAVNVASVRGLYSETAGLDDGIWCFYTNAAGELWEARVFGGVVTELTQITLLPDGVATWLDCWAGLTPDYRIVLQLKGDNGNVYTLLSKSRPGGFSFLDYMRISKVRVAGKIGLERPYLLCARNIAANGNYGKVIKLIFDKELFNVSDDLTTYFRFTEAVYGEYFYPYAISYGSNRKELYLHFNDFNWRFTPFLLDYLGGSALSGEDLEVEAFVTTPEITNLNQNRRGSLEYLKLSNISVSGAIVASFDGKLYENEYLSVSGIAVTGTNTLLLFAKTYSKEYLKVSSVTVAGQYCDINGVPL